MGTFTHHESGKTFRLGLCGQHHRGLPDSGVFTTRNRKVQEDYPYLAIGTFKADEPA